MSTLCIQCALKAVVNGEQPQVFDEEPEEHAAKYHPDPVAVQRERVELERKLMQMPDYQAFVQRKVEEIEQLQEDLAADLAARSAKAKKSRFN